MELAPCPKLSNCLFGASTRRWLLIYFIFCRDRKFIFLVVIGVVNDSTLNRKFLVHVPQDVVVESKKCHQLMFILFLLLSGCEAGMSAKSAPSYLPDLTSHGVNSSFYDYKGTAGNDKNSNGIAPFESQYADHFYEQPMIVFPAKRMPAEVLERSPFLSTSGETKFSTFKIINFGIQITKAAANFFWRTV